MLQQPFDSNKMTNKQHRWQLVDDFFDAFNEHRIKRFRPGSIVAVDESIFQWYGLGGN